MKENSKGIIIRKNGKKELFEHSEYEQFGTTALVLYKDKHPKYVVALNEDCKLNEKVDIIDENGTITLCEVSMKKTVAEKLRCVNYKGNLSNGEYNAISPGENDYEIDEGILYISYDGRNVIEVPGDFSDVEKFDKNAYQIDREKTFFAYQKYPKSYLLYSNTMGVTWQTIELPEKMSVQNLQFVNRDLGYMLSFYDVTVGIAAGTISKTTDGGKTWQVVHKRMDREEEGTFSSGSQIRFFDEKIGFLTMPNYDGSYSELYITKDGGKTFSELKITDGSFQEDIYDYYELPTKEDDKYYLEIGQGSDGDYNGGDSIKKVINID